MSIVGSPIILLTLFSAALALADVRNCACDVTKPDTLEARECGLCKAAERQPAEPPFFFVKDNNPRKPNRWLVLPRAHYKSGHALIEMPAAERTAFWMAAIEKAKSLFPDSWGLAVNGEESRTQCHGHIHIGKLLDTAETANFIVVDGPAAIPLPEGGTGLWVHPVGNKFHVHGGEQINETVLQR